MARSRRPSPRQRRQWALAAAIRQASKAARYSPDDLASRLDVPIEVVKRWMLGDEQPDLEVIHAIEGACSLRPGTILEAAGYIIPAQAPRVQGR